MPLITQIQTVLTRIGTEFKTVRSDYNGKIGTLGSLTTTDKTSAVAAINEVKAGASGATNLSMVASPTNIAVNSDTGTDIALPLATGTNAGLMAPAQFTKLTGIETAADVTTTAKVDAAGAVMNTDTTTAGMSFVVGENDFISNLGTKVPTQQSTKAYVDSKVAALTTGAPALLDTLDEIAAAIGDDANFSATMTTALGHRVRHDTAAQGLTGTQQGNARTNIDVYSKTEIGNPETNFVTTFEAALV